VAESHELFSLNRALMSAENPITALVGSARSLKLTATKEGGLRSHSRSMSGSDCCAGGFFGIEERKFDQWEVHVWDPRRRAREGNFLVSRTKAPGDSSE
jgi:hypothetical protein